jgi:hypothetical protein
LNQIGLKTIPKLEFRRKITLLLSIDVNNQQKQLQQGQQGMVQKKKLSQVIIYQVENHHATIIRQE